MDLEGCIAALAIEDRVDLWFRDGLIEDHYSQELSKRGDYFATVHRAIEAFLGLVVTKSSRGRVRYLFDSIEAFVISVPGNVRDNRILIQMPLFHSDKNVIIEWGEPKKKFFDFGVELADIAESLIKADGDSWGERGRQKFINRVFVVNDATACAAFEHSKRRSQAITTDFVYVKIHTGVNVGVISRGNDLSLEVKTAHAEAGHGFPLYHPLDHQAKFEGVCDYHHSCFQGMIAAHAFYQRAVKHAETFPLWNRHVQKLKREGKEGQSLDDELMRYILGGTGRAPAGQGEGVDILAHYLGLLAYQLSIGPLAPAQIVIGGRLAKQLVIKEVGKKVAKWAHNYPLREELTLEGVSKHIVGSQADDIEKADIEVWGALVIAFSRAQLAMTRPEQISVHLKAPPAPLAEMPEAQEVSNVIYASFPPRSD